MRRIAVAIRAPSHEENKALAARPAPLMPTNIVDPKGPYIPAGTSRKDKTKYGYAKRGADAVNRAKTFPGIARAMAEQWAGESERGVTMTIDEAIRIIDPDTTREALAPYADCDTRRAVVDEACRVAVEALKKAKPQSTALFTTHPSKDLDPVEWVKEDAP